MSNPSPQRGDDAPAAADPTAPAQAPAVRRHLLLDGRHVHHRRAGSGGAVVLLHDAPRSSTSLAPLLAALAGDATAIAIDLPGYGCSDPLPDTAAPAIGDYADWLRDVVAALGIGPCPFYGQGAGAVVAIELARRHPGRVTSLVLDGLRVPTAEERDELRERYAPPIARQHGGGHLLELWTRRRDEQLFYPWYRQERATRLDQGLPSPDELHADVLDALRSGEGRGALHRAEFAYDVARGVAQLPVPASAVALRDGAAERQLERLTASPTAALGRSTAADRRELQALAAGLLRDAAAAAAPPPAPAPPSPHGARARSGIARDHVTTSRGQLLMRSGGSGGVPLLLVHASPGSAQVLEPLMRELQQSRLVLAFDTLGNGESDKPAFAQPRIDDYAAVVAEALDLLGVERLDLFGTHTGALIATELSVQRPDLVRNAILDGITLLEPGFVAELLERYLPPFAPRRDGTHLIEAWSIIRDGLLFWPWYDATREAIRWVEPYDDEETHWRTVDMLKSGTTYPLAYRAAFTYPTAERLPRVRARTLICSAADDVLHAGNDAARALGIDAEVATVPDDDPRTQAAAFARFLDRGAP